jgi:hypothetical protein
MSRKTAICVGVNNYDPASGVPPLKGCINDTLLIGEMLRMAGFMVVQLHDKEATQQKTLDLLKTEVAKLREGDYLVFWNSSHGYQVSDRSAGGDEVDYLDEAICCYDNNTLDPLTDDKFRQIFNRIDPKANVFIGSDSCHSGTVTRELMRLLSAVPSDTVNAAYVSKDLQTLYAQNLAKEIIERDSTIWTLQNPIAKGERPDTRGLREKFTRRIAEQKPTASLLNDPVSTDWQVRLFVPERPDLLFDLGENPLNLNSYVIDAQTSNNRKVLGNDIERYIEEPPFGDENNLAPRSVRRFGSLSKSTPREAMSHLLLSGCQADEVSWDAEFPQGRHGAMTYYFAVAVLEAWNKGEAITYKQAYQVACARLMRSFNQTPQLEGPDRLKNELVFGYSPKRGSNRHYMDRTISRTTSNKREHQKDSLENVHEIVNMIDRILSGI